MIDKNSTLTGEESIMESMQEAAIVTAITMVNRSLGFYDAVSAKVKDSKARQVFNQIALEETALLRDLCSLYQGSGDRLVEVLKMNNLYANPYYGLLIDSINETTSEADALKIALEEKRVCIDWYTVFLDTLRDPHIADIFINIINKTQMQCNAASEEYVRVLKKLGGTVKNNFKKNDRRHGRQPVQNDRYLFQTR